MARLLVTGPEDTLADRDVLDRLVEAIRGAGHDGARHGHDDDPRGAVDNADGVVALLDGADAVPSCLVALAAARNKPVLGLASGTVPSALASLCRVQEGPSVAAWIEALPAFYDAVRPFAGRVVRDRIPALVKEAGHNVAFREVADDDRPRFLKQKVAAEAQELLRADIGREKEEVADVLEALEAFLRARGFDRDELKRVKEAKRKRRGGFEKVFVVESTADA